MGQACDAEDLVLDALERRFGDAEELFAEFGAGGVGVAAALGTGGKVVLI